MTLAFDGPAICIITKGEATADNFSQKRREILEIIDLAVEEKIQLVQLREKNLSSRLLFGLAVEAAAITIGSRTRLLISDRADIALAARADGVHLTANSVSARVIRNSFPANFVIGVSTHTLDDVLKASHEGADFAVFGPVFQTPNKGGPAGLAMLSEVCKKVKPFPVLALGGINESNCQSALEAGAAGIAAIRSLNDRPAVRSICAKMRNEK